MQKEWKLKTSDTTEKSLIKRLLISRGITDEKEMYDFTHPLEMQLTSPNAFVDMEKAIERLSKAIDGQETIIIYGDFDADGVTSTSVLYKTFKHLGANVHYYIPNREDEGHGFDKKALIKLMTTIKPKVVISVDCGISDVDAVSFLNSFKIDVIITDHHEAPEILPPAYAIINPKAPNALSEDLSAKQIEHLTYLAGCGVAFKVAQSLLAKYQKSEFVYEILPFVGVGTVADIVPLLGENRYLVTKGLELISKGKHTGLKKLLESAGYDITKGITSENIAFGVAPRINASGRLDTVDSAVKVLISDNLHEVDMAISTLNELNKVRQELCDRVFEQADAMYRKTGMKDPAIILAHEEWHIGIIGIVASKFVEKYYKPTFLMNYNKEKDCYRCSARSIEGVPLYDVISANSELLDGFGGHALAAGLSFTGSKTPFEIIKKSLNNTVKEYVANKELKPFINIDLVTEPNDITLDLIEELSQLEPFGASNPPPIFSMENLTIKERKSMGTEGAHLRLKLNKSTNDLTAIWWKNGNSPLTTGENISIAFHPQKNEFNGVTSVQLILDDVHAQSLNQVQQNETCKYKIYDHRNKTGILQTVNDWLKTSKEVVKVFAESKYTKDTIKPYSVISNKICDRVDISKCDTLMLFDYPASRGALDELLEKARPKKIHFMNYEPQLLDESEVIKMFTGMLKFASNNNNGKVELIRCASALGKTIQIVEMLLELYAEFGFITIKEKNSAFYLIEFNGIDDISRLLNSQKYSQIFDLISECEEFQISLTEDELETFLVS